MPRPVAFALAFALLLGSSTPLIAEVLSWPEERDVYGIDPLASIYDAYLESYTLNGRPIEWFVAERGDRLTDTAIDSGGFIHLLEYLDPQYDVAGTPEIWLHLGGYDRLRIRGIDAEPAYLAYRIKRVGPIGSEQTVFGWTGLDSIATQVITNVGNVQFANTVVVDGAAAIGESGIIVGTTTVIPEPSSLALLMLVAMAFHRRKPDC